MLYNAFEDATPASTDASKSAKCTFDKNANFYLLSPHFECFPDDAPLGGSFLDYHLNHFACAFTLSDHASLGQDLNKAARIMTHRFYRNFCEIFSEDNIARVALASRSRRRFTSNVSNEKLPYGDMEVVEFHIGGNLSNALQDVAGFVHPDFVGLERFSDIDSAIDDAAEAALAPISVNNDQDTLYNGIQSFCGNTLYRNWDTPLEKLFKEDDDKSTIYYVKDIVELASPVTFAQKQIARAGIEEAVDVNRHHFLAGTRSWCVGVVEGADAPTFFVETAAFERNSSLMSLGLASAMGSRDDINLLWEHLIKNFLGSTRISGALPVPVPSPANYLVQGNYEEFSLPALKAFAIRKHWEFSSDEVKTEAEPNKFMTNTVMKNKFIKQIFDRHAGLRRHIL